MDRYIGLDVAAASCTLAVLGPSGKRLKSVVMETNGKVLVEALKLIPGKLHLCIEEGTQSEWLFEILSPHVDEMATINVRESRGLKSDERDAFALAERIRVGATGTPVYKGSGPFGRLRDLARVYSKVVEDVVRVKNRVKAIFRSRGVETLGKEVYEAARREAWTAKLPPRARTAAELLFKELDAVVAVRAEAETELLKEARKHAISKTLETCPGLGPIRVALMLPIVVTPERFRNKRQFWSYCGLAIVTRSSSDWAKDSKGTWVRSRAPMTRGLNHDFNRTLKYVFKGAAQTVIAQRRSPLYEHYERLLAGETKPNLATLTIARRIAATALAMWKRSEVYDPEQHNLRSK